MINSQADTVQNVKKRISHEALNDAIINKEISTAENLENQDSLIYQLHATTHTVSCPITTPTVSNKFPKKPRPIYQMKKDQSDYGNNGLELSPDEQAERVNLLLLGLASLILMNAMAVLIILFVKLSNYEDQLVMNSKIIKRQTKGITLLRSGSEWPQDQA